MSMLSLLVAFLLPQVTQVQGQPPREPQAQPPAPAQEQPTTQPQPEPPKFDQGPLRLELMALQEMRRWADDPNIAQRMPVGMQLTFRLQGDRIGELVRYGNLIFTELVDSTGKVLKDPNDYTAIDRQVTRQTPYPPDRLRENGIIVPARVDATARGATQLKAARGNVRVILATEKVKVTVLNPFQYYGKALEHPRLKELGVEIEIIPLDQVQNLPPNERGLALRYKQGGDKVQSASFYDGRMMPVMAHPNWMTDAAGQPVELYHLESPAHLTDELQMVFEVHPKIEELTLPVNLENLDLP